MLYRELYQIATRKEDVAVDRNNACRQLALWQNGWIDNSMAITLDLKNPPLILCRLVQRSVAHSVDGRCGVGGGEKIGNQAFIDDLTTSPVQYRDRTERRAR